LFEVNGGFLLGNSPVGLGEVGNRLLGLGDGVPQGVLIIVHGDREVLVLGVHLH
jgi:hypothetical protein